MENQSLVIERTWLQLMYCAPSRLQCPNFRVAEVWRYGDGARVNPELIEQGGSRLLEGNLVDILTSSIIQEVIHIYTKGCRDVTTVRQGWKRSKG